MITLSGTQVRSISDQTGNIGFSFAVTDYSSTGSTVVGLSGTNLFTFSFNNGKIYDPKNNFVGAYDRGVPVTVSGQLGQTSYDYYINNNLVALGNSYNSGKYSWIYTNSNCNASLDSFINGVPPNYYLDLTGKYQSQNYNVTGAIINTNPAVQFRLFDVEINQSSSPYSVESFTSSNISGTGYIVLTSSEVGLTDYIVPLTLYTNFGTIPVNFTVSGDYGVTPDIFLGISPNTLNVQHNIAKNYTIQFSSFPSGAEVGISLQYISGVTGNIYFFQQEVSPVISGYLSGYIIGSSVFSAYKTGFVSGFDPLLNIWSSGTGSGFISAPTIYATGQASQPYSITVYGQGNGSAQINYLISGIGQGNFTGVVPFAGGFVDIVVTNFTGTGIEPGVYTGISSLGSGQIFTYPTGAVTVTGTLIYGTDYYSGNISAPYVFSGPLSFPYTTIGVGYATGNSVSGIVNTNFPIIFDQGLYTFSKFFSGIVLGHGMNTGTFNPTGCLQDIQTSGILSGIFSITESLDCSATTGMPTIPVTGYPSQVYDSFGKLLQPNTVVLIVPSGGFSPNETLATEQSSLFTRTKTSRMGATTSGSGYFQSPIYYCLDSSSIVTNPNSPNYTIWKEDVGTGITSGQFDSLQNEIAQVATQIYLNGSGGITNGIFTGIDSGIINFCITGTGSKTLAFRSLNLNGSFYSDRTFNFYLYKNGFPTTVWGIDSNDPGMGFDSGTPWGKWRATVNQGVDINDSVVVLDDLTSGLYTLLTFSTPLEPPTVYFNSPLFSGCEGSQNIPITICASGNIYQTIWFELTQYQELTAHSGVSYDPVYLVYTPENLPLTGTPYGHLGGFIAPDYTTGSNSVQCYTFTIPIHQLADFGNNPEFNIFLSNCSGCQFGLQETTVQIINNQNLPLFYSGTGSFGGVAGLTLLNPPNIDCDGVPAISPPIPPICCDPLDYGCCGGFPPGDCPICQPSIIPTPNCTGSCSPQACCSCTGSINLTGSCPGYSGQIFSGSILPHGASCGSVSANGCQSNSIFLGRICSTMGSSYKTIFQSGNCIFTPRVYLETCLVQSNCPESGGCGPFNWSGCIGANCFASGAGSGIITGNDAGCTNYAMNQGKQKQPPVGDSCQNLLVFLDVVCIHGVGACPTPWTYQGATSPNGGQPNQVLCPSPPP